MAKQHKFLHFGNDSLEFVTLGMTVLWLYIDEETTQMNWHAWACVYVL